MVIDGLSSLLNHAYPRDTKSLARKSMSPSLVRPHIITNGGLSDTNSAPRRLQIFQYIIGALQKLAATRNISVVILTECATKMLAEQGAALIPAINATVWDQGISTRIALFRNWGLQGEKSIGLHFAAAQKVDGKSCHGAFEAIVAFRVESVSSSHYHPRAQKRTRMAGLGFNGAYDIY